ncbi:MAG: penicillin-insensitive murein endopeptidase [Alphaproteobacteria bacterium]|nr:penicillin-insensitive murein endopeptidase [Alphaproteobacteria bacterium]
MRRNLAIFAALLCIAAGNASAKDWGSIATPTVGDARSIGGTANGCIAGAAKLPLDGIGYQVVRVSRNRMWGHPRTLAFVRSLGVEAAGMGLPPLYIGDLSQPRGGPMTNGHASHQNGNDVDIWFNIDPKPDLPASAREDIKIVRLVAADEMSTDASAWRPEYEHLLRRAAAHPEVERIFVHFAIKRQLCSTVGSDRDWLHKIRPWLGHDDHFHVRLSCPPGSQDCQDQQPIPPGDGCDPTLDWWFADAIERHKSLHPAPARPRTPPKLPNACKGLLAAR